MTFFFFKRHRRNLKHKSTTFQAPDHSEISPFRDPTDKSELQGDVSQNYGLKTTVQHKPELQTASNRHEVEGVSSESNRPWSIGGRHELHEDTVLYQRNGDSDSTITAYDEKTGSDDSWGGGPGAAASDTRSAR